MAFSSDFRTVSFEILFLFPYDKSVRNHAVSDFEYD
jgi:hypothetical protein